MTFQRTELLNFQLRAGHVPHSTTPSPTRKVHLWRIFFALLVVNGPLLAELKFRKNTGISRVLFNNISAVFLNFYRAVIYSLFFLQGKALGIEFGHYNKNLKVLGIYVPRWSIEQQGSSALSSIFLFHSFRSSWASLNLLSYGGCKLTLFFALSCLYR